MLQGTYTAAVGIATHQQRLDVIANNLANSSTNGFKSSRVDFQDALYKEMTRPHGNADNLNMNKGHGVLVDATTKNFTQGLYQETGVDTNMLIEGEGYFMIETPAGQRYYTRDGSFGRSVEGDGTYLVTAGGNYVIGANGQRVRLEGTSLQVMEDGTLWETGAGAPYGQVSVWRFPNQEGLNAISSNLYDVSASSGEPQAVQLGLAGGTTLHQNAVEGSNVDLAEEFSGLIRAQRAMQLSSRALTMADEMDGTATQIRR
ncbi:MAG: flagellar hook-basal body protein [Clostridia bacterium]|nr:flagellar hook-basal body protein [Clostridia bacterium]